MRRSLDRNRLLVFAVLCGMCSAAAPLVLADEPQTAANDAQIQAFRKADRNNDAKLSVDEFIVGRGAAEFAERDFRLYDFNEDDTLNLDEFACVRTESKFDQDGFSMQCPERSRIQLYEFHPKADDPPKLVDGQDATRNNNSACWTPDGKRLIVVTVPE